MAKTNDKDKSLESWIWDAACSVQKLSLMSVN